MSIDCCYVTAFLDIDRHNWNNSHKRNYEEYLTGFNRLIHLFQSTRRHELIVYIDYKHYLEVRSLTSKYKNIYVVPIDKDFLEVNSLLWRRLEKEKEIMESDDYKNLIGERRDYPEHSIPEYTMINHAKIDLVVYSFRLTKSDHLAWIDFGYLKKMDNAPENLIDISLVAPEMVNFSLINKISRNNFDKEYTLLNAPEIIEGGFFVGDRKSLEKYQTVYHEIHQTIFHDNRLVDDDQHVILQIYKKYSDLIYFHYQGKWLNSMKHFQIDRPLNGYTFFIELSGGLGNQLFQLANGYALSRNHRGKFYALEKDSHDYRQGNPPNKYRENIFSGIKFQSIGQGILATENTWSFDSEFNHKIAATDSGYPIIVRGFFQSEKYFDVYREEIRKLFTPIQGVKQWIYDHYLSIAEKYNDLFNNEDTSCFIGVRRSDYLQFSEHNPCGIDYFEKAIKLSRSKKYYVSSDDIQWCKQNFTSEKFGVNFEFFEIQDDLLQFYLGTLFKKYIISNSTFHWWMSYLSVNHFPMVIAPDKWIGGPDCKKENYWSIYRDDMIILQRKV